MGTWESAVTSRLMRLLVTALRREPRNAFPGSLLKHGERHCLGMILNNNLDLHLEDCTFDTVCQFHWCECIGRNALLFNAAVNQTKWLHCTSRVACMHVDIISYYNMGWIAWAVPWAYLWLPAAIGLHAWLCHWILTKNTKVVEKYILSTKTNYIK